MEIQFCRWVVLSKSINSIHAYFGRRSDLPGGGEVEAGVQDHLVFRFNCQDPDDDNDEDGYGNDDDDDDDDDDDEDDDDDHDDDDDDDDDFRSNSTDSRCSSVDESRRNSKVKLLETNSKVKQILR